MSQNMINCPKFLFVMASIKIYEYQFAMAYSETVLRISAHLNRKVSNLTTDFCFAKRCIQTEAGNNSQGVISSEKQKLAVCMVIDVSVPLNVRRFLFNFAIALDFIWIKKLTLIFCVQIDIFCVESIIVCMKKRSLTSLNIQDDVTVTINKIYFKIIN